MKIGTILFAFGLLFVVGTVMLVANTLWADGPAGPIGTVSNEPAPPISVGMEEIYEVTMSVDLPDRLSTDQVKMLVMLGVLRPEGAIQLGLVEGPKCHWVVTYCGGYDWCRSCNPGPGSSPCG
ncbi:MAG: hypothetical protein WBF13_12255, partial [Candidatus Zixiibacteriota bacterium]